MFAIYAVLRVVLCCVLYCVCVLCALYLCVLCVLCCVVWSVLRVPDPQLAQAAFASTYGPGNLPHIRLWVSPYRRTRQTAEIVAAECGNSISSTKEHLLLAEQQFGLFEGMEAGDVKREYVS